MEEHLGIEGQRYYGPRLERHKIIFDHLSVLPTDRVLDVGCALGEFLENFQGECALLVGVDLDHNYLTECRRFVPYAQLVQANAAHLPFADGSFDILTATNLLEHLDNPTVFLKEARRVCARAAVFVTPNLGRPSRMLAAMRGETRYEVSGHKQGWDYHLLNQVLENTGWKVDRIEPRFVDFPLYHLFPQRFSRWMSYTVLKRLFPMIGSELFSFCSIQGDA